ncbi:MAG: AAA family ATPase [Bacteroidales bacterium]|nr:AAA family ATPase [Bacteroidales bacterium]
MKKNEFVSAVSSLMAWIPTEGQVKAMQCMADYLSDSHPQGVMLLKGYAGTGKTTLVSAFVRFFSQVGVETVLLAPTGRAAKVMSHYATHAAYTIHKEIYVLQKRSGRMQMVLRRNEHRRAVFFVDEASMIDDSGASDSQYGSRRLLNDLFDYVRSGEQCFLVLIGDNAQLPPVNNDYSAALDADYLSAAYGEKVYEVELRQVVRQSQESGVLYHATQIRRLMDENKFGPYHFSQPVFAEVKSLKGYEAFEMLEDAYSRHDIGNVVCIAKSNKQANILNNTIRSRILYMENFLDAGDMVVSVKNNYVWLPDNAVTPFIANGDIMEVMSVRKIEECYGFHFADVSLRMADYDMEPIDAKVLLDTLSLEAASLSYADTMRLYEAIECDYQDIPLKKDRQKAIMNNPYWNAIQIKFAYAQTCHKTQGGQWDKVFLLPWNDEQQMHSSEYYRWLYTAVTRSSRMLYVVQE